MSFDRVAMYASGLVIAVIPKSWIVRSLWRINMIHTLGYPRATVIQMQHTELILRPRQKPLAISAPTRIIAALLSRTAPPVARSFIASLFLNFFCGMRVAISNWGIPDTCKIFSPSTSYHPLTYYYSALPHGRTIFTPIYPAKQKTPKLAHERRVPRTSDGATASRTPPPGKRIK